MDYTSSQLDRELQLLLWQLFHEVEHIAGEGRGFDALGIGEDEIEFRDSKAAEFIPLGNQDVVAEVRRLEAYVSRSQWSPSLPTDVYFVGRAIHRFFDAASITEFQLEIDSNPTPDPDHSAPGDPIHPEAPGNYYRGILAWLHSKAQLRLKIDQDELLTLAEVAALIDLKETTVVTAALRNQFPTIQDDTRRWADPAAILPWLEQRGFRPTRRHADERESKATEREPLEDYVLVPVSRDKSWFGPHCRLGSRGYTIGRKGNERKVANYWAALDELRRLATPQWRRRNAEGNWGLVTGVGWERKRKADIDAQLRSS